MSQLGSDDVDRFLQIVSEELKVAYDIAQIRRTLQILPPELWPKVSEVARLRIENKLLKSIEEGYIDPRSDSPEIGAFGTWARDYLPYFTLNVQLHNVMIIKLQSKDDFEREYVARYFLSVLHHIVAPASRKNTLRSIIIDAIVAGDEVIRKAFLDSVASFPADWHLEFHQRLADVKHDDGTPFYTYVDDIPF